MIKSQKQNNLEFGSQDKSYKENAQQRHVAYAFDHGYAEASLLSIASLAAHQKQDILTIVHLVTDGKLPEATYRQFKDLESRYSKLELRWYPITELRASTFSAGWRWPRATYFRLLLPELLKDQTDRVIYIDGDTLILNDLGVFWDTELGENIVAGCVDATWPDCKYRKEQFARNKRDIPKVWQVIPDDYPYMNGGVLLMNMKEWRRNNVTDRCYQMMEEHPESCEVVDQDLLTVLQIPRLVVDPNWNIQAGAVGWYRHNNISRTYQDSVGKSFEDLMREPGILHFCGDCPWAGLSLSSVISGRPIDKLYLRELRRSRIKSTSSFYAYCLSLIGKGLVRDMKVLRHKRRNRNQ